MGCGRIKEQKTGFALSREKEKARYTMKSSEQISPHSLSRDLSHAMKLLEKALS